LDENSKWLIENFEASPEEGSKTAIVERLEQRAALKKNLRDTALELNQWKPSNLYQRLGVMKENGKVVQWEDYIKKPAHEDGEDDEDNQENENGEESE